MRPAYRVRALTGFALVCAVVFARLVAQEAPRERPLPPSVRERLSLTCATDGVRESGRPRLDATGPSLVDGEPLSEALVSQREMDYWNFFSQRLGDRNHTDVLSVDGYGTPFSATGGKVTVSTAIQPRSGDALPEIMEIDAPAFGPRDFRGVALTSPMPSRFAVGQTTTFAGRVRRPVQSTSRRRC